MKYELNMPKTKAPRITLTADTCRQITGLVSDYLTGELSPALTREFKRHLHICPDCVSFLNTYKKTVQTTRSVEIAEMPAKVRDNILTFIRHRMRRVSALIVYLFSQLVA